MYACNPLSIVSASIECDLEGRFSRIRTGETNLGNLVTDIMRSSTRSEIALLNSGTFRSDALHEAGVFRVKVSSICILCRIIQGDNFDVQQDLIFSSLLMMHIEITKSWCAHIHMIYLFLDVRT